jgi:hypothetical protein
MDPPPIAARWSLESLGPALAMTADWWNQSARLEALPEELFQTQLDRLANDPVHDHSSSQGQDQHHCPACGAIIYSRRHRLCGVCGRPLPTELIFSEAKAAWVQSLVEIGRERHRRWLAKTAF